eukprot:TRINITY_DN29888_c0_g1_i1.p1 TRINITY_DN29888_c0_g1~~TRINITY_DN29888_c0_g1_i1.p1  ORF type:complete len:146 (+),score=40.81 TRINITY_DN29888_c0_g1_i1:32-469(+)
MSKQLSEPEWKERLTPEQYKVLREGGCDSAGNGKYYKVQPTKGHFACSGCGTPLYGFDAKFPCDCGWPAFSKCYVKNVQARPENSHGEGLEICCTECKGHLGHIYKRRVAGDPEAQRHCVNSTSIEYREEPADEGLEVGIVPLKR